MVKPSEALSAVQQLEARLRAAMLQSDLAALDELIDPGLLFTTHLGQVITKEDDLAFHRSGAMTLTRLDPSEQRIMIRQDMAVVSVLMHVEARAGDAVIEECIRYTRVWSLTPGTPPRVLAGHACLVADVPPGPPPDPAP